MPRAPTWWVMCLLCLPATGTDATADTLELAIAGQDVPVQRYIARGERLILWLPSERGVAPTANPIARSLATTGVEVWVLDLHAGFFLPEGPHSLDAVPKSALPELITQASERSGKTVYLMGSGRTAALVLEGVRAWQLAGAAGGRVGGALLLSPGLYRRTPQGGEKGELVPIAHASNLPIYLIQPELSAGRWWVAGVVDALEAGGSPVYLQRLPGVSNGFYIHPEDSPAALDAALAARHLDRRPTAARCLRGRTRQGCPDRQARRPGGAAARDRQPVAALYRNGTGAGAGAR